MIVINFKNYKTGKPALNLAKKIEKHIPNAIVCVPTTDIRLISKNTKLKVYAQHADFKEKPASTGYDLLKSLKQAGAKGVLLNHSEHKIKFTEIYKTSKKAKELGLKTIICLEKPRRLKSKLLKGVKPYAIAYEIPSLISSGKSITEENPEKVKNFVKALKKTNIKPLCGAGISTKDDVIAAKDLGCEGVLIASAIAKAKNPEKLLKEISEID